MGLRRRGRSGFVKGLSIFFCFKGVVLFCMVFRWEYRVQEGDMKLLEKRSL